MAKLTDLPIELLGEILESLSPRDLKCTRLTCKVLAGEAIKPLFRRICLSRLRLDLNSFLAIASDPKLNNTVRTVVWYEVSEDQPDTAGASQVFWRDAAGHDTPGNQAVWVRLAGEWPEMERRLMDAFKNLRLVNTISSEHMPLQRLLDRTPSTLHDTLLMNRSTGEFYRPDDPNIGYPLFLRALIRRRAQTASPITKFSVTEFFYTDWAANALEFCLPADEVPAAYPYPEHFHHFFYHDAFTTLTHLDLDSSFAPLQKGIEHFAKVLEGAQRLESLRLSSERFKYDPDDENDDDDDDDEKHPTPGDFFNPVIEHLTPPKLRRLTLSHIPNLDMELLVPFLLRHAGTLRVLRLHCCSIAAKIAISLAQNGSMRLESLHIRPFYNDETRLCVSEAALIRYLSDPAAEEGVSTELALDDLAYIHTHLDVLRFCGGAKRVEFAPCGEVDGEDGEPSRDARA